jgi:hypothetical protein
MLLLIWEWESPAYPFWVISWVEPTLPSNTPIAPPRVE